MIARALFSIPGVGRAIRWFAGVPLTLDQRIAHRAALMLADGYLPLSALAAAEAVEVGREHGLLFDDIEFDHDRLTWTGRYETRDGTPVTIPLYRATQSTQAGVASLN